MGPNVIALCVCLVVVIVKLPRAIRGGGRVSTGGMAALCGGLLLTIPAVYLVVDGWLGGINLANVLVRAFVFIAASAMAVALSRSFNAPSVELFVLSWKGATVLAVSVAAEVIFLLLAHPEGSAAGLPTEGRDELFFAWYATVGYLYPAYLSCLLIVPLVRYGMRRQLGVLIRMGCWSMAVALGCIVFLAAVFAAQALGTVATGTGVGPVAWVGVSLFGVGMIFQIIGTRLEAAEAPQPQGAAPTEVA